MIMNAESSTCGGFSCHLSSMKKKVTANQYKVILSYHLYPVIRHLCLDGSGVFQVDSSPIYRARGLTEWCKLYAMACTVAKSQPSGTESKCVYSCWKSDTQRHFEKQLTLSDNLSWKAFIVHTNSDRNRCVKTGASKFCISKVYSSVGEGISDGPTEYIRQSQLLRTMFG